MKKLLAAVLIPILSAWAAARSLNLDPNQCSALSIGIVATSPTQVFTNDPAATKSYVINTSTNVVYIVGYSTTSARSISTNAAFSISLSTGSFYLPAVAANTQPIPFVLDGPADPYTGPLWAVAGPSGAAVILRCRTH